MTWDEAIIEVLKKEKREMHSNEVANLIIEKGYRERTKTPERTVSMQLNKLSRLNENIAKIENQPGYFIFKDWFPKSNSNDSVSIQAGQNDISKNKKQRPKVNKNSSTTISNQTFNKPMPNSKEFYLNNEVHTEKKDWGVSRLYELYKRGKLILQPTFQRKFVWDNKKSSRLIDSVLMNFPIPLIYLSEEWDGTYIVIDGQQRLQSLFSFIDGSFPDNRIFKLNGLSTELNGKKYNEIDPSYQDKIQDYSMACVLFKKQSDPEVKFNVFERLNTGSVPLNAQEVRNCIYHGNYNDFLIRLSENDDFKSITNFDDKSLRRMKGVEWVLRFAAFYNQTHLKYKNSTTFFNEEMQRNRDADENLMNKLESAFKNSVSIIRSVWGENAFSRYIKKDGENSGCWDSKKNAALYEVLMFSFAEIPKSNVQPHLDAISEALLVLMTKDEDFKDSISMRTNNKSMVIRRFDTWLRTLNNIIDIHEKEPRCFSLKLKQKLYKKNQTCQICNQNINDIDDSEVDHIEQYWLGGKTIPKNARLVHRYCNRSRSKLD
jgi:hypothetical protein